MDALPLLNKTILITGAARRVGKLFALGCAQAGADIIIHYGHSASQAEETCGEIEALSRQAWSLQADLSQPTEAANLITLANQAAPLFALVNSAAIFESLTLADTALPDWERHLKINLTAPFLLSQAFAAQLSGESTGRIVNILDWRALRPRADHFPYTISKAALAALTQSMAAALAPQITVNGLALGAVLPPVDAGDTSKITAKIPMERWSTPEEVQQALIFLLSGPAYVTGEIIYVDGGRHLI
jgi:NAD(P)-dependent dehydrogenase (short-subunit alcohol dehydrogenase family)